MSKPAAPTTPGDWIGQVLKETYRIDDLIGEGGTGHVFRGFHLRLRVPVAVKVLRQNAGPVAFARFRKEAEITARLRHPGIVQVVDYDVTPEGHAYLVTEWLEGETLGAYLRRRGALPAEEATVLVRQVCEAVGAAHAAGVVHRDLKPANLFLIPGEGAPVIKVLDFGIAKLTELDPVRTEQGQTLGTPRYMSPEQIRIDAGEDVGPSSDQWSLGVIAYELVSGKPAFPGSAHAAMLAVLDNRPAPLPQGVPATYRAAVARAMASRPEDRFPGMAELRQALELPPEPEPEPPSPVPPSLMIGGAALCVILLLLIVWVNGRRAAVLVEAQDLSPARAEAGAALTRGGAGGPGTAPGAIAPTVTPLDMGPSPAAGPPPPQVTLRVRLQPPKGTVFVSGRPLREGVARVPVGVPLRIKVVPQPRSCCSPKELSYTVPPAAGGGPAPAPLIIDLRCDKDCPLY